MQTKFVNRYKEFSLLEELSNEIGRNNNIVMLCGQSGVGKSELTNKFIRQKEGYVPGIKVSIQQAEKNSYSSGYYITRLARTLHEYATLNDSKFDTLTQFLKKGRDSTVLFKKVKEHIKTDLASKVMLGNVAKGFFDLWTGTGEFDVSRFFESTHSDILITNYEYVKHVCCTYSLIINIENIQSIDARSLELFIDVLQRSNNCLFLLEYTDDDHTGYSFGELVKVFEQNNLAITPLSVNPLNADDVKKLIDEYPQITWDLLSNSYVNWNGNLRLLMDILTRVKYGLPVGTKKIDIQTGTKEHLRSLSHADLFMLSVIATHKEPAERNMLAALSSFRDAGPYVIDIAVPLDSLTKRNLIKCSNSEVVLAHDSILNELSTLERYDVYTAIAQRFWLESYEQLFHQNDLYTARGTLLMKILYFASLLCYDAKILQMLGVIDTEALKSRDPERMIRYVEEVKNNLSQKADGRYAERIHNINLWLIEIWYKLGNSRKAWAILQETEIKSRTCKVLKAMLLEQVGQHQAALDFCDNELKDATIGTSYELTLRLVKLVTNYDIGATAESDEDFFLLYDNPRYRDCLEYGFLLRNAELVFSYQDSLPYYVQSIDHFMKFNATRQAAFSRITYGVHLGLTGKYQEAEKQFMLAMQELGDVITEKHTLLNNLAVLQIMQRIYNGDAADLLKSALVTATGDFEKVAIMINYLSIMDWHDKRNEVELTIESILRILQNPSFANKEIIGYAYYDFFKYYERTGNHLKAKTYRQKLINLKLPPRPLWDYWLDSTPLNNDDEEFYVAQTGYAVSFLCNWNMEFDSTLMQY